MQFRFHCQTAIPPLAWCAQATIDSESVDVWHGAWVEPRGESFVEGIWDGPFAEDGFDQSCLMGSGGLLRDGRVLFVSPWHTLENLFLAAATDRVVVSNSLPFLLECSDLTLEIQYPYYRHALWSIRRGIKKCVKQIPTAEGVPIQLIRHANVQVSRNLQLTCKSKAKLPAWEGFASYRRLMSEIVSRLTENASSPSRRKQYHLLTTVSSGYDSSAASALAVEAGCRHGITFNTGLEYQTTGRRAPDSGRDIGRILGLEMEEFCADSFETPSETTTAEFAACGDGFDLQFAAFERRLAGAVLFTGHPGSYWNPHYPRNTQLARQDTAGTSLGEFRMRTGFVHLPIPTISAPHQPQLVDLSGSPEMLPWSVGGDYDRPVPRRIVEEMGVPRTMFGQSKKGSFRSICLFQRLWHPTPDFQEFINTALRQWSYPIYRGQKGRFLIDKAVVKFGPQSVIVQWGTEIVRRRYQFIEE